MPSIFYRDPSGQFSLRSAWRGLNDWAERHEARRALKNSFEIAMPRTPAARSYLTGARGAALAAKYVAWVGVGAYDQQMSRYGSAKGRVALQIALLLTPLPGGGGGGQAGEQGG